MKTLRGPRALARCLVVLALLLQGHGVAEDGASRSSIQTTMHAFFRALTSAFPWSLDAQQFQAPEHHQHMLVALRALAQHAGQLDTHGQDVPQSFGFLRRSLNASRMILRYLRMLGGSSHELQPDGVPQTPQSLVGSN